MNASTGTRSPCRSCVSTHRSDLLSVSLSIIYNTFNESAPPPRGTNHDAESKGVGKPGNVLVTRQSTLSSEGHYENNTEGHHYNHRKDNEHEHVPSTLCYVVHRVSYLSNDYGTCVIRGAIPLIEHWRAVALPLAVHPGHPTPPAIASARGLSAVRAVHGGFLNVMHSVVGR